MEPKPLSPRPVARPKRVETRDPGAVPALLALLDAEAAMRRAERPGELALLTVNEMMRLAGARQVFLLERGAAAFRVSAISSVPTFDPNAPLIQGLEARIDRLDREDALAAARDIDLEKAFDSADARIESYPFRFLLWVPATQSGAGVERGFILARERPWSEKERAIPERLAATFAHANRALRLGQSWLPSRRSLARAGGGAAVVLGLLLLWPVPMTVLAPFEVASSDSIVVAAPIDGVIETLHVEPNAPVRAGDLLVSFTDTALRNRAEIAEREMEVARARLAQVSQLAFRDEKGRHDLGITRAEMELKVAERDYARDLLAKAQIRAERDGIAVYTDKRDLLDKPVSTGFRIMEIADPERLELRIDVAVSDAMTLAKGARVKAFFDADPLRSRAAQLSHADYLARLIPGNVMAFRAVAELSEDTSTGPPPRLGARGTAQIHGATVALGYFLFRRPISALRQRFGL